MAAVTICSDFGAPFKKIRDTKGIFHEKMGLIKDRNGMDLTEAEDIKKRIIKGRSSWSNQESSWCMFPYRFTVNLMPKFFIYLL